jgi:hypothetical protein
MGCNWERDPAHAIRWDWKRDMAITVNGRDMKDAVIKTDQYEMRILELLPDHLKLSIKETAGHPFNFVPRFVTLVYPEGPLNARDTGIIVVAAGKTVEPIIEFERKIRIETFIRMELQYARKKLATIAVE